MGKTSTRTSHSPVFPGAAWATAAPESQGLNASDVEAAVGRVHDVSGENGVDEMLIVRNGLVIREGAQPERRHPVWSCTKSFLSTCLGLLWDDGKVTPDTRICDFVPEIGSDYSTVTLEHVATLTSGFAMDKSPLKPSEPLHAPGAAFHYSRQPDLLALALTRAAGRPLADLFAERIADPTGIGREQMLWKVFMEDRGIPVNGGSGEPTGNIEITPRALARFGWLFANDGVWNGQRLISKRYIEYATTARTSPNLPPHDPEAWYADLPGNYGLGWWTNGPKPNGERVWPSAPARTFAAQGNKNNNCFIIPPWHMTVVRMGQDKIIGMGLYDRMFELLGKSLASE